ARLVRLATPFPWDGPILCNCPYYLDHRHRRIQMIKTRGYAAQSGDRPLQPFNFERRTPGPGDVQIDILYCGVCHSDLHTARNEWNNTLFPSVPGHEIVGRVAAV